MMTESDKIKEFVTKWRRAAPELDKIRCEEIRRADPKAFITACGDFFAIVKKLPKRTWSGLCEQQAIFKKLRK